MDMVSSSADQTAQGTADVDNAVADMADAAREGHDFVAEVKERAVEARKGAQSRRQVINENISRQKEVMSSAIDESRNLTLLDIAMGKVTGLSDALGGKVDKIEGYSLLSPTDKTKLDALVIGESGVEISGKVNAANVEGLGDWITTNRDSVARLFDTTNANKLNGIEAGAQVNDLEVVKIAGTALPISDKAVDIPIATAEALGVVLGSAAENKVSVGADGTMEVNSVNVNKLVQTEGEALILNGGSSTV